MTIQTIYKQLSALVFGVCLMPFLTSCGGKSETSNSQKRSQNPFKQELGLEGRYTVKFYSLNSALAGNSNAEGRIQIVGDKIAVGINMKDSPARTQHAQTIYEGSECPSEVHDTNSDGFIDPIEASKILGQVLIPLDGDLNGQLAGIETFPVSNFQGNYSYYKEGELSQLLTDLKSEDLDLKDELKKMSEKDELKLEGKVIVIQGISDDTYLPGSIRTFEGVSDRASLSIACGKIVRTMIDESETNEPQE